MNRTTHGTAEGRILIHVQLFIAINLSQPRLRHRLNGSTGRQLYTLTPVFCISYEVLGWCLLNVRLAYFILTSSDTYDRVVVIAFFLTS